MDLSLQWNHSDSVTSPLSPLRSPIVADWKAVGSPIGPQGGNEDSALFETDSRLGTDTSQASPERNRLRRQRAMSLIEKGSIFNPTNFSPFDFGSKFNLMTTSSGRDSRSSDSSAGDIENGKMSINNAASPDKLASQVAQLPQALHEELGVENADEATEIFKRSSMDSLDIKSKFECEESPVKPLSAMPSLFGRMPFGPAAMVFGGSPEEKDSPNASLSSLDSAEGLDGKPSELSGRRHSALFGLGADWATDNDFNIDEYFMNSSVASRNDCNNSINRARRHPRRHSIAETALFPEQEEHLGSLSLSSSFLESSLSPSAASFHYKGAYTQPSPSFLDYMSMAASADGLDSNSMYPMSPATIRDVTFQLSTYKGPLYAVEFKAGRTEIFYVLEMDGKPQIKVRVGELVIVEADRGEDLGKVTIEISVDKLKQLMMPGSRPSTDKDSDILTPELAALVHSKEIVPKRIHRLAQSSDLKMLQAKAQEEAIAMVRCQSRIRQKKLPMEVVDAEYQWDRNKLTFYFCADRRIDFRELVRDLFRIYKTRIWMCAVDKSSPRMLMYTSPSGAAGSASIVNFSGGSDLSPFYASNYGSGHPSPS